MNAVDMLKLIVPDDEPSSARPVERDRKPLEYRVQGNWKRIPGVATRYELALAVDTLLEKGTIRILDGVLHLARAKMVKVDPMSPAERWAREDDELRAYCQRMEVHETRSASPREWEWPTGEQSQGAMFDATVARSEPRPGISIYILRELQHAGGGLGYAHVIDTIFDKGGYEWVLEEPQRVFRQGQKSRSGR